MSKIIGFVWAWWKYLFDGPANPCAQVSIDMIRAAARELADALDSAYAQAWETGCVRDMDEIRQIVRDLAERIIELSGE